MHILEVLAGTSSLLFDFLSNEMHVLFHSSDHKRSLSGIESSQSKTGISETTNQMKLSSFLLFMSDIN